MAPSSDDKPEASDSSWDISVDDSSDSDDDDNDWVSGSSGSGGSGGAWDAPKTEPKSDVEPGSGWDLPEATPDAPRGRDEKAMAAPELEDPDGWVIEVEESIDPADVEVERVGTVEEVVAEAREEAVTGDNDEAQDVVPGDEDAAFAGYTGGDDFAVAEAPVEVADDEPEVIEPAPAVEPAAPAAPVGFQFGKRDPHEKASRLARVLVSDMITYNPERHTRAVEGNTIKEDFEDEIEKSWSEYVDQVGAEMAESTDYWKAALNEILAGGKEMF